MLKTGYTPTRTPRRFIKTLLSVKPKQANLRVAIAMHFGKEHLTNACLVMVGVRQSRLRCHIAFAHPVPAIKLRLGLWLWLWLRLRCSRCQSGERVYAMGWLFAVGIIGATLPSYIFSKARPRALIIPVSSLLGIICCFLITWGVGASMIWAGFGAIGEGTQRGVFEISLTVSAVSIFLSPISAIVGWRNGKRLMADDMTDRR